MTDSSAVLTSLAEVQRRVAAFEAEAHQLLARHEAAIRPRVMTLDGTRRKLEGLSILQNDLLSEALDCIQYGMYRAAHVAAWQAFMDVLEQKLAGDKLVKVHAEHPNWARHKSIDELRENVPEHQIIDVARAVGLISKNGMKSLHGMLSTRNDCAHPSTYKPDANQALGYVSDLIQRIATLQQKSL